ncbi:hypothetical protein [Longispora albida]|uniref:hypothetical protein n=1 Tax=Longispora albida TaxID=203523 RepID=UPI00037EE88C|nr:hypothetical protein [Longispora albida]
MSSHIHRFVLADVHDVTEHAILSARHRDPAGRPLDGPALILRRGTAPARLASSGRGNPYHRRAAAPAVAVAPAAARPGIANIVLPLWAEMPMLINGVADHKPVELTKQLYIALVWNCTTLDIDTTGTDPIVGFTSPDPPGVWPGPRSR